MGTQRRFRTNLPYGAHVGVAIAPPYVTGPRNSPSDPVEVLNSRTYDESSALFYRFQPEDRDRIQALTRAQLREAGEQSGLLPQADRSARQLLESLLAQDGYSVVVTTRTDLAPAPQVRQ